ncbi:MAG: PorP/SprF family type IX secretion system membrane protein, partial [Marinilabiliaceae bacterium]|nr:PorP/SprF family type IX secretion system membrane protein [Marinilabiliaceae bacterium]
MVIRSDTIPKILRGLSFALLFLLLTSPLHSQHAPDFPISYRIFNPFVFNPAVAGSKDFTSVDMLISNFGKANSQLFSGHTRLSRSEKEYFTSVPTPVYTNIGVGAYLYNEYSDPTRNIGFGATGSYHLKLDRNALSYLSVGATAKAIFNRFSGDPDTGSAEGSVLSPNLDAGVYYYSPTITAGISATNILGTPESPDSLGIYKPPVSRQYFFHAGYKFFISRFLNLLLEPTLLINASDSLPGDIINIIK